MACRLLVAKPFLIECPIISEANFVSKCGNFSSNLFKLGSLKIFGHFFKGLLFWNIAKLHHKAKRNPGSSSCVMQDSWEIAWQTKFMNG